MTEKQIAWHKRIRFFFKLKSWDCSYPHEALTKEEQELMLVIKDARNKILDNVVDNSIKLGFNAKRRCKTCGTDLNKIERLTVLQSVHLTCPDCKKYYLTKVF